MLASFREKWKKPPRWLMIVISLFLLYHLLAVSINVLIGGSRAHTLQRIDYSLGIHKYLDFLWMTNAYRFFAPDPGPSNVVWFRVVYTDKTARCVQIPEKRDFSWRMPMQRQVSLAMLLVMNTDLNQRNDETSAAQILSGNPPAMKRQFSDFGEEVLKSYIRHVTRDERYRLSEAGSEIDFVDVFACDYNIRDPGHIRMNWDMYDPRLLFVNKVGRFTSQGNWKDPNSGFKESKYEDLFIDLFQQDLTTLIERKGAKSFRQVLDEYRLFDPLAVPLAGLSESELARFFDKPHDRESIRERYRKLVERKDKPDPTAPPPSIPGNTAATGSTPPSSSTRPR